MPAENVILDVERLAVCYATRRGEVEAVSDITFSVSPGETVSIVGESGSGKTTTIRAAIGMLGRNGRIARGRVLLDGRDATSLRERDWRRLRGPVVGWVPQDPASALNPLMTVGAQLAEAITLHEKLPRAQVRERVLRLLADAGLPDPLRVAGQRPYELSGGMCQRVLIAIAISCRPRLLIADEPTSALDVTVQRGILDHLAGLVESTGMGMVLITHDLAIAADRAQRVFVMRDGLVVESGPASDVIGNPRHDYTQMLIQSAPALSAPVVRVRERTPQQVPGAPPAVRLRGLVREFPLVGGGTVRAVDGVDLDVAPGETVGVVGESGSGKSTLARLALRLDAPTDGRVQLHGEELAELSRERLRQLRRRAQMIYQNPFASLSPRLTVRQLVAEPLEAYRIGTPEQRHARVDELLDLVSLSAEMAHRRPGQLSGGQRQRVAIARALSLDPDLLVCDEPTSALDVSVQARVLALLERLRRERGIAMLFISHDLGVVRQVADRVVVMRSGRVVETGPVESVFDAPSHEYTAALIDAIPGRPLLAPR